MTAVVGLSPEYQTRRRVETDEVFVRASIDAIRRRLDEAERVLGEGYPNLAATELGRAVDQVVAAFAAATRAAACRDLLVDNGGRP